MKKTIWKILFAFTTFFFLSELKAQPGSASQPTDAKAKPMNEIDIVWGHS